MENHHYETRSLLSEPYLFLSSLTCHPLFSITVALYSLILLYFPRFFLNLIFSPVLISTGIIISALLRLGTTPELEKGNQILSASSISEQEVLGINISSSESEKKTEKGDEKPSFISESFVEYWNLSAPLDVIHEEYEGQGEDGKEEVAVDYEFSCNFGLYYPESDDDTGSESDDGFDLINGWDSPKNMCYRWEDDKEGGLIEIELNDEKRNRFRDYHDDEEMDDNLIEIEIS